MSSEPMSTQIQTVNTAPSPAEMTESLDRTARPAPVALFVYNRPDHTRRTVEALQQNTLAPRSDLFVFADGARSKAGSAGVQQVRQFIRGITGFRSITLIERDRNFGLTNSVIDGVSQIMRDCDRAIAVEDDLMTSPDFLTYINLALARYGTEYRIFSVSGFNYPVAAPASYPFDSYFAYCPMCWGWGMWKDRWQRIDWSVSDYPEFVKDRKQKKLFERGGGDLSWLLARQMAGKIDSWDTIWAYSHFKHDAVALLPVVSKVYNTGFDGSGIHCRRAPFKQTLLTADTSSDYRFPEFVELHPYFVDEIRRLRHRSLPRRLGRFIYDQLGLK
jgi:hypothetical protein